MQPQPPVPPDATEALPPLFDMGNALIASGVPCTLVTGKIPVAGGEVGVVTFRTATTTLTLTLDRATADQWAVVFAELRDNLSASGIMVASRPSRLQLPGR